MRKWRDAEFEHKKFKSVDDLKRSLAEWINLSEVVVGYIEPGHGAKVDKDGFCS